jgi:uncharacterized 2Fe-2S/4Fe-4S cluster protein (DUF4445 family)
MKPEFKVTFEPSGRSVHVMPETVVLEAAARAGFIIESPCGGAGTCGKCQVRITAGDSPATTQEQNVLGSDRIRQGWRMACQCRINSPLTIEIPESALFQASQKILSDDSGETVSVRQRIRKHYLNLTPPSRDDDRSDAERLREALGEVEIDLSVLRVLPAVLRRSHFEVTVVTIDNRVIEIESGVRVSRCGGIAFDIGPTTVVGTLVDLETGVDIAVASMINPQTSFGDDVLTRIQKCREEASGLRILHDAIVGAVNQIIRRLLAESGMERTDVYEVVFAGNTTMQQILCGVDPSALGEMPFVPAFRERVCMQASELGLEINPRGDVNVLPQIGGFVGGDTVAGIVATHLDQTTAPTLLVDVGTNGEIVLAHRGKLIATSVAAGPAFEGARIRAGMRAVSGAIEKVIMDDDVRINVIGNTRPAGICGSGLVDAAAELLRTGILDSTGRILPHGELPAGLPETLLQRVIEHDGHCDFILVHGQDSATGEPLCLYQRDIRELQLANAAIRAGIRILLQMAGLTAADLGSVLLAGAFGNFIRRNHARRIGMLPPIPCEQIRFVGNTASFGAKSVLLSTVERAYATRVMQSTRHVDLSMDPGFQMEFGAAMLFPEAADLA